MNHDITYNCPFSKVLQYHSSDCGVMCFCEDCPYLEYEKLVEYLAEYGLLDDAVCDLVTEEIVDEKNDITWCEINCDFQSPQEMCIKKFAGCLLREKK